MAIKQGRYITADTTGKKEMTIRTTELDKVKDDPFVRRSEVQQTVNNSTLPVSSRAVNLFLSSYASITYVDERFNSIDLSKYLTTENANQTYSTKAEVAGKWDVQETVGNGKVMREGAYGLGSTIGAILSSGVALDNRPANGLYRVGAKSAIAPSYNQSGDQALFLGWNKNIYSMLYFGSDARRYSMYSTNLQGRGVWSELLTDTYTRTDKHNVLHAGTKTPIDTLNVSDMADTVIDNDEVTVTSGAVYRAIGQLMDQISSLEARVEELEDGGV